MEKILLDTNFLLIPAQFNVDVFSEMDRICHFKYKLYILDKSMAELQNIAKKGWAKEKWQVKLTLELVNAKINEGVIQVIKTNANKYVDDLIKGMADEYIVATQDTDLKKYLKRAIVLRQKSHLVLIQS